MAGGENEIPQGDLEKIARLFAAWVVYSAADELREETRAERDAGRMPKRQQQARMDAILQMTKAANKLREGIEVAVNVQALSEGPAEDTAVPMPV